MAAVSATVLCLILAAGSALPSQSPEPVVLKNAGDVAEEPHANTGARYMPDIQNVLHLFTRANPSVSQPVMLNNNVLLSSSNFDPDKRTAILAHGWAMSASSPFSIETVPAFLAGEDMNVFAMDWSAGAGIGAVTQRPENAVEAGLSLARTINWLVAYGGTTYDKFHLVGFSLGAHLVAVAGRNVNHPIPYVTALDPSANMEDGHIFARDAGIYTEAIHTNAAILGHGEPVAHVDFFPNGGDFQPGCGLVSFLCNHERSFMFFAESLRSNSGFIGTRCQTLIQARTGLCFGPGSLRMGGIAPKTGSSGIFHLTTNEEPPFGTV